MRYLIFILCLLLAGCDLMGNDRKAKKKETETQAAIQKVLAERNDIRQVISHQPQNAVELAAANDDPSVLVFEVQDYVKRLRMIPLKGCPEDFKTAFVSYAEAWNDRAAANPDLVLPLKAESGTHVENNPEAAERTQSTWRALQDIVTKCMAPSPTGS